MVQCTASVYVAVVHCWGDLLGVSRFMECDLLSVLSIYPRIFLLSAFIVYHLLFGISYCVKYLIC